MPTQADTPESVEALVRSAQAATGEAREQAFNRLVEQFSFAAQSWAYQVLGDAHAAQDAAQEAFIVAHERLNDLREPAAFAGWLRRIVWSQCQRDVRQGRRIVPLDDSTPGTEDPAQTAERRLLHEDVRGAVRALPEHERVVTELFYLNGYSQQEIAEALGVPLTTVKKRLQYAREHLREAMPSLNLVMLRAA